MMELDAAVSAYYDREYSYDGVLTVDSDGKDVTFSLALRGQTGAIERRRLSGLGRDPRIELLANRIWDDVRDQTIDLRFETERAALEKAALDFIESGKSEVDGMIYLSDGDAYGYYLNRKDANKMQTERGIRLETELGNLLEAFNLADRSNSVAVFAGKTIGNEYLVSTLGRGFRTVEQLSGALAEAVQRIAEETEDGVAGSLKPLEIPEPVNPEPVPMEPEVRASAAPVEPQPEHESEKPEPKIVTAAIPVIKIDARVITEKTGMFKKKKVLDIGIDSDDIRKLKWKSVLVIQEKPLTSIIEENVVKEYSRGDELPFYMKLDLPLKNFPKASKLRIYFKPDPDERVGINEAYTQFPVSVDV